jgi:hypothetical protein
MHQRILFGVLALLLFAALACNLSVGGDDSPPPAPTANVERPTVTILEPIEGARFTQGETVSVKARATSPSGITLVELLVNGIRVDSQPPAESPPPQSIDVVLDYNAQQTGNVLLAVRAYSSNNIASNPVTRSITVLAQVEPGDGGAAATQNPQATARPVPTATQFNPTCRARVDAGGLRFRTGPGVNYDIILNFQGGEEPPIQGYGQMPDGLWWQLSYNGRVGWTFADYTTQLGNCSALRPAAIPASPTPQVTDTPPPATVTPTPTLPDLQLSVLSGPTQLTLPETGSIRANFPIQVINEGGQASGAFRIGVLKPDGEVEYFDIPGLAPGDTYDLGGPGGLVIEFTLEGVNRILVTVDDQYQVVESNENNNQAYLDVTVRPAQTQSGGSP